MKATIIRNRLAAIVCIALLFLGSMVFSVVLAAPPADWQGENMLTSESEYDANGWLVTEGWTADGGGFSVYNFGVSTQFQLINSTKIDLTKPFRFQMYFNGSGNVGGINLVPELEMFKGTDFTDVKENENYKGTDMRNHGSLFPFAGYLTAPNTWVVSGGLDNSESGNPFNISAAKDMPADVDWSKNFTTVEMYVGTDSAKAVPDGDVSWIKVNGEEIVYEVPLTLTRADFADDFAYLNIQYNAVGAATDVVFSAIEQEDISREARLPYIGAVEDPCTVVYTAQDLADKQGYTFSVRPNTTAAEKIEYYGADGTWKAVDAKYIDGEVETENSVSIGYSYTVLPSFFMENYAEIYRSGLTTLFRVTYEGGDAVTGSAYAMIGYRSFNAPVFEGDGYAIVDEGSALQDIVFKVDQEEGVPYDADDVSLEVTDHPNLAYSALSAEDYSVSFADGKYTITLYKEFIQKQQESGSPYLFRFLRVKIGMDVLTYRIQFKDASDGWVVVDERLAEGSEVRAENGYLSFELGQYVESATDFAGSGIFYNRPFGQADDYTIAFEMDYPYYTCWAQFIISDSPFNAQYASHMSPAKMHMLLRGYGSTPANFPSAHGLIGFKTGAQVDISDVYTLRNKALVEIHVGKTAEEGYYKINGKLIDTPNFTQSDFPDGLYLSMLWNNTNGENTEDVSIQNKISVTTVSSVVNGVYLKSARTDDVMSYSLKSGEDIVVELGNVKSGVEVWQGESELGENDFSYESSSGKLTIKDSYLSSLSFATEYVFNVIEEGNGGTSLTFGTKVEGKGNIPMQSFSFAAPADLKFDLSGSVTELILDAAIVDASDYTVNGNSLTLKKEYLSSLKTGKYVFYANVGSAYDVVRVVIGYSSDETGIIVGDNYTLQTDEDGNIVLGGGAAFQLHGTKDLTAGFSLTLQSLYAAKYFEDGLYSDGAAFDIVFDDLNSGTKIAYTLFANFDESMEDKAWVTERICVYGADGTLLASTSDRKLTVKLSEGISIDFKVTDTEFVATIGDQRASTLALPEMDVKSVAVAVESNEHMFGLIKTAAEQTDGEKTGCGGIVSANVVLPGITLTMLCACMFLAKKRSAK